MPEWIRETSLAMGAPRCLMIRRRFYLRRSGFGSVIDEAGGVIDEDFDPRRGQPDVGRARLSRLAWDSLVTKNGAPSR